MEVGIIGEIQELGLTSCYRSWNMGTSGSETIYNWFERLSKFKVFPGFIQKTNACELVASKGLWVIIYDEPNDRCYTDKPSQFFFSIKGKKKSIDVQWAFLTVGGSNYSNSSNFVVFKVSIREDVGLPFLPLFDCFHGKLFCEFVSPKLNVATLGSSQSALQSSRCLHLKSLPSEFSKV